ncbi:MvaI/BcnI family restriction endonuclease [Pseudomonas granadensis]|uniref:MvaI/BcnI family restriction endonuclease n=1 Tax=Pseudomonas granadensis TaxID=1421430 RepID=UPI00300EC9C8
MALPPCPFEHTATSLADIYDLLQRLGCDMAMLKFLPKNANDKNQVYWTREIQPLQTKFTLKFGDRGISASKECVKNGDSITEAVFESYGWVDQNEQVVPVKNAKVIIYPQYPEVRLSGFTTVQNTMPRMLSVNFTKTNPNAIRLMILGRIPGGACVGLMYIDLPQSLLEEINALPGAEGSRACKLLIIKQGHSHRLASRLREVVDRPHRGCRLDAKGKTLPFTGTQVCGYTLEQQFGITPNSAMDGDFHGIELKVHTTRKVTLCTTEPDFGVYAENFEGFMTTHGYESTPGEWRVTGLHRATVPCAKSNLTLHVREYRTVDPQNLKSGWICNDQGERQSFPYDPKTSLTAKMNAVEVVLLDPAGKVAAGWSLARLMNNWGAKHNEAVYISANKSNNTNAKDAELGFKYEITFASKVIWCGGTSAERLLEAICAGTIFLDPAPKFMANDRSKNKRRCQWRVNDINKAVHALYENVNFRDLSAEDTAPSTPSD